jgi:hypothetical protein
MCHGELIVFWLFSGCFLALSKAGRLESLQKESPLGGAAKVLLYWMRYEDNGHFFARYLYTLRLARPTRAPALCTARIHIVVVLRAGWADRTLRREARTSPRAGIRVGLSSRMDQGFPIDILSSSHDNQRVGFYS